MDTFLPALISALPQLGGAGVILVVLVLLLRSSATDRADYRAELKRLNGDHDAELAELRGDIKELRKQVDDLHAALDLERQARRRAEDMAAEALRRKRPTG